MRRSRGRRPPPRSADCPIRPPPVPGWFFGWWSRPQVDLYNYNPPPRPCRPPSNTPYENFPRRSPPPRSAGCPIHPPPAPGCFFSWWHRPPVGPIHFYPQPRPCRPPSNTPYDYLPRRFPPPRSEDCPIHRPPAPDCFYPWWSRPPVGHNYYDPAAQTVPSPFKYTV